MAPHWYMALWRERKKSIPELNGSDHPAKKWKGLSASLDTQFQVSSTPQPHIPRVARSLAPPSSEQKVLYCLLFLYVGEKSFGSQVGSVRSGGNLDLPYTRYCCGGGGGGGGGGPLKKGPSCSPPSVPPSSSSETKQLHLELVRGGLHVGAG